MTEKKKPGPESIVREIKRNTRRKFSSEEKIRIVRRNWKLRSLPLWIITTTTGTTNPWRMSLLAMFTLAEEKKYLKEENELRTEPY